MILQLTWRQVKACRHWGTELHRRAIDESRQVTAKSHEVAMPAIGWRTLADRMMEHAFHPSGRHRKSRMEREGTPATRSALATIERALARLQMHPALRYDAWKGSRGDVVLAWPLQSDNGPVLGWSVYPIPGAEPMVFVPEVTDQVFAIGPNQTFTMQITTWKTRPWHSIDVPGAFLDPGAHEVFLVDDDESSLGVT